MRRNKLGASVWVYALPILLTLTSVGCGLTNALSRTRAEATPTRTPMPTFTPTQVGVAFVQAPPTPIPQQVIDPPTPTTTIEVVQPEPAESSPLPTPEPTEKPRPTNVTVTLVQNMNVRTGPGTNYPIAGPGPAGETAKVLGRNANGSWLQVEYPLTPDGTGWVFAELVQVNGDAATANVVESPPPAAVAAAAPPKQEESPPPAPETPKYQFTPTGWHASENAGIAQFKGRIRDEGGNLVNGFSILADNGSWSVLSHPTGASNHYPDKGDGEWDVVLPNLHTAQGWWWLTVVTYDCPNFFAGFDATCKQFTRHSEDVKVEIRTPEESIINADWVCHWDCNKGLYVDAYRKP